MLTNFCFCNILDVFIQKKVNEKHYKQWNQHQCIYIFSIKVRHVVGAFDKVTFEMILSPVKDSDFGTYKCQVKNAEGTSFDTIELKSMSIQIF